MKFQIGDSVRLSEMVVVGPDEQGQIRCRLPVKGVSVDLLFHPDMLELVKKKGSPFRPKASAPPPHPAAGLRF